MNSITKVYPILVIVFYSVDAAYYIKGGAMDSEDLLISKEI